VCSSDLIGNWINNSSRPWGQRLSPKQRAVARKKIRKYCGQLVIIACEKERVAAL
jgi:hypothetical protein